MDMTKRKQKKSFPNRARMGMANASFKHGAYVIDLLTDEEREQYHKDIAMYLKAYPYLKEPICMDMLKHFELGKIRLQRLESYLFDPVIVEEDKISAMRLANDLLRVLSLLGTRMGITYVSRQRRKEKIQRKTPLEILEDEE